MGLSFAFYESMKRLVDPPLDSSGGYKRGNSEYKDVKQQSTVWKDGTIASLFKKAFCGGVSGGLAKFSVYPLVSLQASLLCTHGHGVWYLLDYHHLYPFAGIPN